VSRSDLQWFVGWGLALCAAVAICTAALVEVACGARPAVVSGGPGVSWEIRDAKPMTSDGGAEP
jgi:hypothetical protein